MLLMAAGKAPSLLDDKKKKDHPSRVIEKGEKQEEMKGKVKRQLFH